ncbi:MAG: hypothetical protein AAGE98_22080 [Actinomycetota bacterium]
MRQIEASGGVEFRPDVLHRATTYAALFFGFSFWMIFVVVLVVADVRAPLLFVPALATVGWFLFAEWRRIESWAFATDQDLLLKRGNRAIRWFAWDEVRGIRVGSGSTDFVRSARAWVEILTADDEIVTVWGTAGGAPNPARFADPVGDACERMKRFWDPDGERPAAGWPVGRQSFPLATVCVVVSVALVYAGTAVQ